MAKNIKKSKKTEDNKLLVVSMDGYSYGFWQSDIKEVLGGVFKLHKLPYFPERVAGMASVETGDAPGGEARDSEKGTVKDSSGKGDPVYVKDITDTGKKESESQKTDNRNLRTGTFFDFGVTLGHRPIKKTHSAVLFTMDTSQVKGKKPIEGFALSKPPQIVEANPKDLIKMPKEVSSEVVLGCIKSGTLLIPVVDIKSLYKTIKKKDWVLPSFDVDIDSIGKGSGSVRVFGVKSKEGEESEYGLYDGLIEKNTLRAESYCRLKFAPNHIESIAYSDKGLTVIYNTGVLLGKAPVSRLGGEIILIKPGGIGLLVSSDKSVSKAQVKEIHEVASTPVIKKAIVRSGEITPVVDIGELLSGNIEREKQEYVHKGVGLEGFGSEDTAILGFTVKGIKNAIPRSEEEDSAEIKKWRHIEGLPAIVLGVAEYKGEILPVLDVAACFGLRIKNPHSKMIVIKKAGFKALVVTEAKPYEGLIVVPDQKTLPINLEKQYVYGCYVDSQSVGLILNMEALVRDFDEEEFKEYFGAVAEELDIEVQEEISEDTEEVAEEKVDGEVAGSSLEEHEHEAEEQKIDASVFNEPEKDYYGTGVDESEAKDINKAIKDYEKSISLKDEEEKESPEFLEYEDGEDDSAEESAEDEVDEESKEEQTDEASQEGDGEGQRIDASVLEGVSAEDLSSEEKEVENTEAPNIKEELKKYEDSIAEDTVTRGLGAIEAEADLTQESDSGEGVVEDTDDGSSNEESEDDSEDGEESETAEVEEKDSDKVAFSLSTTESIESYSNATQDKTEKKETVNEFLNKLTKSVVVIVTALILVFRKIGGTLAWFVKMALSSVRMVGRGLEKFALKIKQLTVTVFGSLFDTLKSLVGLAKKNKKPLLILLVLALLLPLIYTLFNSIDWDKPKKTVDVKKEAPRQVVTAPIKEPPVKVEVPVVTEEAPVEPPMAKEVAKPVVVEEVKKEEPVEAKPIIKEPVVVPKQVEAKPVEPKKEVVKEEAVKKETTKVQEVEKGRFFMDLTTKKNEITLQKVKKEDKIPEGVTVYTVVKGDVLWRIAKRFTGDPYAYPKLAKDSEIQNPHLIYPGDTIYIRVNR